MSGGRMSDEELEALRQFAAAARDLAAEAVRAFHASHALGEIIAELKWAEMQRNPDLAYLDVQMDGFYGRKDES